jgi:hypothetical protein
MLVGRAELQAEGITKGPENAAGLEYAFVLPITSIAKLRHLDESFQVTWKQVGNVISRDGGAEVCSGSKFAVGMIDTLHGVTIGDICCDIRVGVTRRNGTFEPITEAPASGENGWCGYHNT